MSELIVNFHMTGHKSFILIRFFLLLFFLQNKLLLGSFYNQELATIYPEILYPQVFHCTNRNFRSMATILLLPFGFHRVLLSGYISLEIGCFASRLYRRRKVYKCLLATNPQNPPYFLKRPLQ